VLGAGRGGTTCASRDEGGERVDAGASCIFKDRQPCTFMPPLPHSDLDWSAIGAVTLQLPTCILRVRALVCMHACVCAHARARVRACAYVCVLERACVCVCVCVCRARSASKVFSMNTVRPCPKGVQSTCSDKQLKSKAKRALRRSMTHPSWLVMWRSSG